MTDLPNAISPLRELSSNYQESKKPNRRQNARWLVTITSVLILLLAIWLWYESLEENNNLNSIGQGENVVVQIHDTG